MDLTLGKERLKNGEESVAINDVRLMRAIKEIIYFSEIFPKQYKMLFHRELQLSQENGKVMSTDDSGADNQEKVSFTSSDEHLPDTVEPLTGQTTIDSENLYWSKEYVLASNEFLTNKFGFIYASLLVNKLFKE